LRGLVLLTILAAAFGLAAWWQQRHVAELRAAQRSAEAQAGGAPSPGEDAGLEPGEAVLVLGRPSGAPPRRRAEPPREVPPQPEAPGPSAEVALGDYTHEVQPGQTLSGIAYLHYGREGIALVEALAAYNGLAEPDLVRPGQVLRLPPREVLEAGAGR